MQIRRCLYIFTPQNKVLGCRTEGWFSWESTFTFIWVDNSAFSRDEDYSVTPNHTSYHYTSHWRYWTKTGSGLHDPNRMSGHKPGPPHAGLHAPHRLPLHVDQQRSYLSHDGLLLAPCSCFFLIMMFKTTPFSAGTHYGGCSGRTEFSQVSQINSFKILLLLRSICLLL